MNVSEKIEKYLSESVIDAKVLKIAKDTKGPVQGDINTLFLLMSDIYDLPETQIVAQLRKLHPEIDTTKTVTLIKKIRVAVDNWKKGTEE